MAEIERVFQDKVRVRVCGLLLKDDQVLLLKHKGLGESGYLWSPPGGGLQFGETVEKALVREFQEETGLMVSIREFLFVNEFISAPFHAVELFFRVEYQSGILQLGMDPELRNKEQILEECRYFSEQELDKMESVTLHSAFKVGSSPFDIFKMSGFFKFENISK